MNKIVLGVALAMLVGGSVGIVMSKAGKPSGPRWLAVATDMTGNTLYVDRQSVSRSGGRSEMWAKTTVGDPSQNSNIASVVDLTVFDCNDHTSAMKAVTSYNVDHTYMATDSKELVFTHITPDSLQERAEKVACA